MSKAVHQGNSHIEMWEMHGTALQAKGGKILPFSLLCGRVTNATTIWSFLYVLEIHDIYQDPR